MKSRITLLLWFALCIAAGAHVRAEGVLRASRPDVKKSILEVIDGQLAALRAGDVAKAYGFASSTLRAQTPLRAFVAIVQTNYPELWGNERAEYGIVRDDGTRARVLVQVFAEGRDATFDYVLVRERGAWRIGSVLRHDPRKKADA
jgi:hypothetical protein